MPLQPHMKMISVDDHLIEHPTVWTDRLPAKYQHLAPRVITAKEDMSAKHAIFGEVFVGAGQQTWMFEDRLYPQLALNAVAGKDPKEWQNREPTSYEDIIPGCWKPAARVADMDMGGIHAMVMYPTFPRFAGTAFLESEDKELALLSVRAWNDFVFEEWSDPYPDRFIPISILPLWDVDLAVAELERVAERGSKGISFPENPAPLGLPSWTSGGWDKVCAAAQAHDMPLCMHFGTSGKTLKPSADCSDLAVTATMGLNSMITFADLLFSPVFHKFPQLKAVLAEGGIGWLPYMLERAELSWSKHRWHNKASDVNPRDLWARNLYGCYITDAHGVGARHEIGVDRIMWECDYPHSDSDWPHSRKMAADQLKDVPDDEVHQIVELTARKVFNFTA
ncbi:Amidohydrolase [Pseudonocardia oroxyli]|uniref:Amidohydrolase n=2 Tax=Pseudonocardia oroxyli TaxID=366584 RepID=A0A1G7TSX1_PSEOR|nr:Amidohydrolase [Pseudonocardia oroxyli]